MSIGASKLNEKDVEVIKYLFIRTSMSDTEIGDAFGVSRAHINRIRHGYRWNDETKSFQMKEHQPDWWNNYVEDYIQRRIERMVKEQLNY